MSFLDYFLSRQPKTASLAKERLQVIITREGGRKHDPELLLLIKRSIIAALSQHVQLDPSAIDIDLECNQALEVLSVSVTLPDGPLKPDIVV